ncbi:hypothetical protein SAMN06295937_102356 [Sphingopyxis flava]|uniref:Uncharacterized protein n=2 Tax=Sphingopyxis flava TaxID=1507287 RepID=A0A1T5ENI6_9SPHN|nr:hypothetical protein SAMN06295937_102356 [Sphingopyxis flava]
MASIITSASKGKSTPPIDVDGIGAELGISQTFMIAGERFLEGVREVLSDKTPDHPLIAEVDHAASVILEAHRRVGEARKKLDAIVDPAFAGGRAS